jgi:aryl-alcohol dehydrogenase-like predicted oxidoreductase
MEYRNLGRSGLKVSSLCLGTMNFGGPTDEATAGRIVAKAREQGVNFIDSADAYQGGKSEEIVGRTVGNQRHDWVVATKLANQIGEGANRGGLSRKWVMQAAEESLRRLGTDYIDIYRPARLDPAVPIEDTIGALADMIRAGYVRHVGLSEVGADTIRRAHAVHPIADLQIEYSLMSRGIEEKILPTTRELGIAITAYGVLSRGLLSGRRPPAGNKGDLRIVRMPRFQQGNIEQNVRLVEGLRQIGSPKGASPAQLALAWVRSRGDDILPVMGARRRGQLKESVDALGLKLSTDDLARIDAAVSPELTAGTRYDAPQMAHLDSEAHA